MICLQCEGEIDGDVLKGMKGTKMDVDVPDYFPEDGYSVQAHKVYLSFDNDGDGLAFRTWLEEKGMSLFMKWRTKDKKKRKR